MRFSLDANVLIYLFSSDERDRATRARSLVGRALTADCVLTLQCLGEFLHVVTRKGHLDTRRAARHIENWLVAFPVVSADAIAMTSALGMLSRTPLSYWDALLLATVREAGCGVLLSEDMQHGADYDGVRVLNPFLGDELPDDIAALLDVA